ncbi:hypothetical protein L3Y34_012634 [Caenorhabditis briggsae]|uniref:Uncharacterized protein n=3 Tax=Caenorhabditis briggsae TaxID=6238 RepID=A0AAE9CVQ1_CAEBR|nr:hypothetical protein L3Y34_012634 [Caenorhabditis briggsae]
MSIETSDNKSPASILSSWVGKVVVNMFFKREKIVKKFLTLQAKFFRSCHRASENEKEMKQENEDLKKKLKLAELTSRNEVNELKKKMKRQEKKSEERMKKLKGKMTSQLLKEVIECTGCVLDQAWIVPKCEEARVESSDYQEMMELLDTEKFKVLEAELEKCQDELDEERSKNVRLLDKFRYLDELEEWDVISEFEKAFMTSEDTMKTWKQEELNRIKKLSDRLEELRQTTDPEFYPEGPSFMQLSENTMEGFNLDIADNGVVTRSTKTLIYDN